MEDNIGQDLVHITKIKFNRGADKMKLNKSIDNKLGQTIPQGEPVKILIDEGKDIYIYPHTRNGAIRGAWVTRGDVIENN